MSKYAIVQTLLSERIFNMDNMNLILEKIRSESFSEESTAEELEKQLELELKKPHPDYDLADELSKTILEARGQTVKAINVKPKIQAIRRKNIRRVRFPKWAMAVSAACVVLIGANAISVSAWDMNIFSAIVKFTKGGMSVNLNQKKNIIELPISEEDPYGIKAKCAEYDIFSLTPHYLPKGFELVDFYADINEAISDICFFYQKDEFKLNITYTKYADSEKTSTVGIPTDTYNLQEVEINRQTAFILKEDKQFTATFLNDGIVCVIFSNKLDYDECQKVIESMK